jgi:hypothetical protein
MMSVVENKKARPEWTGWSAHECARGRISGYLRTLSRPQPVEAVVAMRVMDVR